MAKPATIKIRLNSTAGTGHFYVTKKNARTMTERWLSSMTPSSGSMSNTRKARSSKIALFPGIRGRVRWDAALFLWRVSRC